MARKAQTLKQRAARKPKVVDADDTTEVRRTEPSQMPLPSEKRILQHIATFEGYQAKIKAINESFDKAKEVCKADGIDPKTITDAIKEKKKDPLKERRRLEERAIALKAIGATYQLSIYDIAFGSPVEQARAEARQAARAGRSPENRWPEGSEASDAYRQEYSDVQASMVPGAGDLSEDEVRDAVDAGLEDQVIQ